MKSAFPTLVVAASIWATCFASQAADAPAYPARPIQIVVPVAAGGGTDVLARALGQKAQEALKQPIIVDNKVGAGGNIGTEFVADAKPDGYTLLLTPATIATNVAVYKKLRYDLLKDFQPVTMVSQTAVVLVVHPQVGAATIREFVALAKRSPATLNFGTAGTGSPQHLQGELFNQIAGIKTTNVPYKGQSAAMNDLVGGQIQFMFSPLQNALPFIQQGRVRAIGLAASGRHPALPGVPTFAEAGYDNMVFHNWFALLAPARTPKPVLARLNAEFVRALASTDMRTRLDSLGFDSLHGSPDQAADFMRAELVRWARVAAYAGVKAE